MPMRRLDERARAVIALANEIAHEYELEYVGTEHLLIALVRHGDNAAALVLRKLGADEPRLRATIEDLYQRAKEDTWVFGRLPGSPHYRNVIERAMEIADQLDSREIGAEHLLLGLFHDQESTAQRTLSALGITAKRCREEILRHFSAATE